jgi:hypothetical protein
VKLKMPSITSITSRRAIKQPSNNCYNSLFPLQTPVERSERVAGCWAVRARANPLSLGVWHFTLRFVLSGVGLATPGRQAVMQSPLGPKVYPKDERLQIVPLSAFGTSCAT